MKKIYAIADVRERKMEWVTDPIVLENDVQASIAFTDYQRNIIKNHVKIDDLRIYKIGTFDNENNDFPIMNCEPEEIAVNITGDENE